MLKNVVLPAPLGPMSDTIEPRGMSKSTLLTASSPPNRLVTPRALTSNVGVVHRAGLQCRSAGSCMRHTSSSLVDRLRVAGTGPDLALAVRRELDVVELGSSS